MCFESSSEWEFGGLYVTDAFRSRGVAKALAMISISNQFVWASATSDDSIRLIAHVHEENDMPRGLLAGLGFHEIGKKEEVPGGDAPKSMKRNAEGNIIEDVFEFDQGSLTAFSSWLSQYRGVLSSGIPMTIEVPFYSKHREAS